MEGSPESYRSARIFEVPGGSTRSQLVSVLTVSLAAHQLDYRFSCPNPTCHTVFSTHDALAQHLSSSDSCLPSTGHLQNLSTTGAAHPSRKTATYHPYSGYAYGCGENTFQKMDNGPYKQERSINLFYPFCSQAEWSLAKFLVNNLTQAQINQFLALPWVHFFWVTGKIKHLFESSSSKVMQSHPSPPLRNYWDG